MIMTDWERMKEQIAQAMQSAEALENGETLQAQDYTEVLDATKAELIRLETQLKRLQWALDNPGQYSMDEVFRILSRLISGQPCAYRKSQTVARNVETEG
jgi:hypothetical protein